MMPLTWPSKNPGKVTAALNRSHDKIEMDFGAADPGSRRWKQLISKGADGLGIGLSSAQLEKLACHAAELLKWNKKFNLTRISSPAEMAIKHYVDSLACVPHISDAANVLDIGSGGGFPGILVAVAAKPGKVLMIDSVRKKISFLQHAIRLMGLDNCQARHIRAQELKTRKDYGEFFDIIVCRALAGIDHIIELALPLLKDGGTVIALKGRAGLTEKECRQHFGREDAAQRSVTIRTVKYRLPVLNAQRNLVLIKRQGQVNMSGLKIPVDTVA